MGNLGRGRRAHVVVHICGSKQPDRSVVGELDFVDIGAVVVDMSAVVDVVGFVHHSDCLDPVESVFSVVRVCIIIGVFCKSRCDIKIASVGD